MTTFLGLVIYSLQLCSLLNLCDAAELPDATLVPEKYGEKLYDCLFTSFPQTPTALTVSMYHLLLDESSIREPHAGYNNNNNNHNNKTIEISHSNTSLGSRVVVMNQIRFEVLNLTNLRSSKLRPDIPFVFFTNGFNHQGGIENSWMYDLATVFVRYYLDKGHTPETNVVFIPWQISGLMGMDPFSIMLVYYRTMSNYELVLASVVDALTKIVDFVEAARDRLADGDDYDDPRRSNYYSKFRLYGHSLGAHIISHAADRVNRARPFVKFGQVIGLDPAVVCFRGGYGISATKLASSASRVVVIHSNAGITGLSSTRGNVEIFINGGSFQPDCPFYDLLCHHSRSHDILRYVDDECAMVAYRCDDYEQFKVGACQLCEDADQDPLSHDPSCILVNLAEQHAENNDTGMIHRKRQLASDENDGEVYDDGSVGPSRPVYSVRKDEHQKYHHFVNTNPQYLANNNSHCLQHYQLRLLTMADETKRSHECPLSSFLTGPNIQINLFEHLPTDFIFNSSSNQSYNELIDRLGIYGKSLTSTMDEILYTGLVTFAGKPKLFTSAIVDGFNLSEWSKCMIKNKLSSNLEFVLDIAFMSSTRQK